MILSKPAIVFYASQIFFNFLALACFAGVASFQAKYGVGPSGLSGFALFIATAGIFLSLFLVFVPVFYEKYDKFPQLARTLREVRVAFILTGTGTAFSLLIAFITTISAFTQPGCSDPNKDPHASKGDQFKKELPGWCSTKRAGSIFFWLAFMFWGASLGLLYRDWRNGNLKASPPKPRDPPFTHPPSVHTADEEDDGQGDEESTYHHNIPAPQLGEPFSPSVSYNHSQLANSPFADPRASAPAAGRPSLEVYGAFSDPAPTGYATGGATGGYSPGGQISGEELPRISRTMQYADPYAAVRASIAGGPGGNGPQSPIGAPPPSYDSYQGYR
jgi:hypothetical protein